MPHIELSLSDDPGETTPDHHRGHRPDHHSDQDDTTAGRDPDHHAARGPWADPPANRHSSLRRWTEVVTDATEPCVVLDPDGVIIASSRSCLALLGAYEGRREAETNGDGWIGRGLLDVLHLVDLTAEGAPLASWESERVPPLLALATGSLARGVMRFRIGETTRTVDTVSTPLRDGSATVGSLSFLNRI